MGRSLAVYGKLRSPMARAICTAAICHGHISSFPPVNGLVWYIADWGKTILLRQIDCVDRMYSRIRLGRSKGYLNKH